MNTNDDPKDLFAYAKSEFLKQNYGKSVELLGKLLVERPKQINWL